MLYWSLLPHEVLQHGALSCALPSDHGNLWQVEVAALADATECILESVDQGDQFLHALVTHGAGRVITRGAWEEKKVAVIS